MISYGRRFIPQCAHVFIPLTNLLEGNRKLLGFTSEALNSFKAINMAIADATTLVHLDVKIPLSISVDASNAAIGAVLQQQVCTLWIPLVLFSRKLSACETRCSAFDRELLTIHVAIKDFRPINCKCPWLSYRWPVTVKNSSPKRTTQLNGRNDL